LAGLLVTVFAFVTALHLLVVLFTGGYDLSPLGIPVAASRAIPAVVVLLVLVLVRLGWIRRGTAPASSTPRDAGILFAAALLVYLANGRTMPEGDTNAARYLPLSILREGNFDLDEFPFLHADRHGLLVRGGRFVSGYPVGAPVLATPFYLPSALGFVNPAAPIVGELEKLSAAVITAASAMVLYSTLRLVTSRGLSVVLTIVYALATSNLSISSQALWQHGPAELALIAAIHCLLRGASDARWVKWAGFPLAFAVVARPLNVLVVVPLVAFVLRYHRRRLWEVAATGVPPVAFQLWYNTTYFGHPLRSQLPADIPSPFESWLWDTPLWTGLTGLLFSPSRGLFVYSPVFLFSVVGAVCAWRRGGPPLLRYLSVGAGLTVLANSKWHFWWGGDTYGPRLLADITPILVLLLWPAADLLRHRRVFRYTFIAVAAWSVAAHAIGAFYDDRHWHFCGPNIPERRWWWTDNQLRYGAQGLVNRVLMAARGLPTSRTDPALLAGSYRPRLPPSFSVEVHRPITLSFRAVNTGQAVWLAGREETGSVWLVGRWWRGDTEIGELRRMAFPCVDVLPGQSYRFRLPLSAPSTPGTYRLVLQLGSLRLAWFEESRTPPIRFTVDVRDRAP
jgi:hypothetical protein